MISALQCICLSSCEISSCILPRKFYLCSPLLSGGITLATNDIKISMDGKGAWRDNVFVERLWRTIKYEEVYLHAYASVPDARASIGRYLSFYNTRRPHSSLDGRTPDQAYFKQPMPKAAAA